MKVIWLDALSDTDEIETGMIILGSEEFRSTEVYDIEGDLIGNVESDDILELLVTQDPIIIVRHLWEGIGEENAGSVPSGFRLISVYPNPFNSQTIINFSLSQPSSIRLAVYDLSGRVIDVIMEDRLTQGEYQVVWNADGYPAGLYFIRLEKGSNYRICKALLVK